MIAFLIKPNRVLKFVASLVTAMLFNNFFFVCTAITIFTSMQLFLLYIM